jgi:hypothetical protein
MKKFILMAACALALSACGVGQQPAATAQLAPLDQSTVAATQEPSPANQTNATLPPKETTTSGAIAGESSQGGAATLDPSATEPVSVEGTAQVTTPDFMVNITGAANGTFTADNGLFASEFDPSANEGTGGGRPGMSRTSGIHTIRFADSSQQFELRIQLSGLVAKGNYTVGVNTQGNVGVNSDQTPGPTGTGPTSNTGNQAPGNQNLGVAVPPTQNPNNRPLDTNPQQNDSNQLPSGSDAAGVDMAQLSALLTADTGKRSFNVLQSGQLVLDDMTSDNRITGHFEFHMSDQNDPNAVVTVTGTFSVVPLDQVNKGGNANTGAGAGSGSSGG